MKEDLVNMSKEEKETWRGERWSVGLKSGLYTTHFAYHTLKVAQNNADPHEYLDWWA